MLLLHIYNVIDYLTDMQCKNCQRTHKSSSVIVICVPNVRAVWGFLCSIN